VPRRIPAHRHWDHEETRAQLLELTQGVDLRSGGVAAHVAVVPLFRNAAGGGLEQAVRIRIKAATSTEGVTASVSSGGQTIDRITVTAEPHAVSHHLFVPEVSADQTFTVSLATPGSDADQQDVTVSPQRKWTVHLVHHSHFDYGYTDPQATVMEHQLRYIDAALDLIRQTDDWDDDAKFRWNVEVTYPLTQWLATRPKPARDEFVARVNEGRIEVHALPFSMHTEVFSIDELAWGFKFAESLRKDYGIKIVTAIQSDVPGATVGLLNLMTSAGVQYFSVAHNYAGRSVPFRHGGQDLTRPFWWKGGDGKRVLVWQADTPHGVAYMEGVLLGLGESAELTRGLLPEYLKGLAERPYPYGDKAFGWHDIPAGIPLTKKPYPYDILTLRMQNGFADNAPPSLVISETVRDWNAQWAFPKLRMATSREFFANAASKIGDKLDEFEGDWTDWWVDGVGSGALPLGLNRQAQATIRTAQTLHALAGENAPANAAGEIDRVYGDLALFDEHTWGAANPWLDELDDVNSGDLQWRRKSSFAYEAYDRANALLDAGLRAYASDYGQASGVEASLLVFNPSGWSRTDLVRVYVPAERLEPGKPISVMNAATGKIVPFHADPQGHPGFRAKGIWLTFAAANVPPVGFVRFDVVSGGEPARAQTIDDPFTLESRFYRVTVDPRSGFIASIMDRETGRELVDDEAPFGFNEYIYDRYTTAAHFNHLSGRVEDHELSLHGSRSTVGHASLVSRDSDPVNERLKLRLVGEGSEWIETTISLPHEVKRIDIENRIAKIATPEKESVYFAFPFAVDDADPEYEITGGATSQAAPHVPGAASWMFAVRHWLTLKDDKGSVAWTTYEAPLVELGTISLPYAPFPSTLPEARSNPATIYSWALNNIWDTNFPDRQGGEMVFRYAVTSSADGNARQLGVRAGASASAPLVGFAVRVHGAQALPASVSFVEIESPLIELVRIAPSRTAGSLAIFLQSVADEPVTTRVRLPGLAVASARLATFQEEHGRDVSLHDGVVAIELAAGAYVTLIVSP
jgi:Glycosyl hydrolases family 38 N-terminal domain/Glycosyl hydrolases family 38 C-terminal domain